MSFRGRILVIRGGAIGDFILTLPALAALRQQFPDAFLEVLGYPHIAQLALAGGLVNQVQSIEAGALAGFFARNGSLAEHLADYFSEFDLIISYLYDPDSIFRTNVGRCSAAQFIAGPHRPDEHAGEHACRVYLKPLERLAIFDADAVPRLRIGGAGNEQKGNGNQDGRPTLALHPGSGSERKNWAEENWAELLQLLINQTDFQLLLVGGEAEGERLQRLATTLPPSRCRVAQSLPLTELARLLQGCAGFVGHDSGVSHLASAVGVPGLLLWSDTPPEIWRPSAEGIVVLKHPTGISELPVVEVFKRLEAFRKAGTFVE